MYLAFFLVVNRLGIKTFDKELDMATYTIISSMLTPETAITSPEAE